MYLMHMEKIKLESSYYKLTEINSVPAVSEPRMMTYCYEEIVTKGCSEMDLTAAWSCHSASLGASSLHLQSLSIWSDQNQI